ncbi:Bifunctional aspartate aminotransferase and L-aspartate beta-decarboxylase [compost metagenome]
MLLPGKGFGTLHPSGRVSLANLNEQDYVKIGQCVRKLRDEYLMRYRQQNGDADKTS